MRPALILQHGREGPPGLLGEWLDARGLGAEVCEDWRALEHEHPEDYAFLASLGSWRSPRDDGEPEVAAELNLLGRAVERDVPVLGLCFGGQALAAVLGGRVEPSPVPELGWSTVETDDPDTVAPGPWLQWHFERFTLPPGAEELARSAAGTQAFRHGRHLGVQFHPESTVETVARWARADAKRLARLGIEDAEAQLEAGAGHAAGAREAAFRLFDAFWEWARR
jgi:GMP synthase-like glutamine amidotransferase